MVKVRCHLVFFIKLVLNVILNLRKQPFIKKALSEFIDFRKQLFIKIALHGVLVIALVFHDILVTDLSELFFIMVLNILIDELVIELLNDDLK